MRVIECTQLPSCSACADSDAGSCFLGSEHCLPFRSTLLYGFSTIDVRVSKLFLQHEGRILQSFVIK